MCKHLSEAKTPVSVLLLSGGKLVQIHSFTSSTEDLTRLVDAWISKSGLSPTFSSSPMDDSAQQLPGYMNFATSDPAARLEPIETIARAYRGIPGRKKLIWVSSNFMGGIPNFGSLPRPEDAMKAFHLAEKAQEAWRKMSDANIAVYPIDSNGVTNPTWEGGGWPTTWGAPTNSARHLAERGLCSLSVRSEPARHSAQSPIQAPC